MDNGAVHLTRGDDAGPLVDDLAARSAGRVGLSGVLADLNREASPAYAPGRAVSWGFSWRDDDVRSTRWWPQGITSSGDASLDGTFAGRPVLITTSYAKPVGGVRKGARISVVDLSEEARPRYRHVLLARTRRTDSGGVDLAPMRIHAGGAAWSGRTLHVAGTGAGVFSFDLDDIVRADDLDAGRLGYDEQGRLSAFGHRYVLPLRVAHRAGPEDALRPMRYSFISVGRDDSGAFLVAGEYTSTSEPGRLVRFRLDAASGSFVDDAEGRSVADLLGAGVSHMQGAVLVDGDLVVTASNGRFRRGDLWSGRPGDLRKHPAALPVGPEDLAWWPARETLWTLSEYPSMRYVVAVPRSALT